MLITVVPAPAPALGAGGVGNDVDGAAWGVVDGEIGSSFAVDVDGAGVVEELVGLGGVWVALLLLKLRIELADGNHFYV